MASAPWSHGVEKDSVLEGMAVVATCFLRAVVAVIVGNAVVLVVVQWAKNHYNG